MTDADVIARAEAAGWVWLDAPNRWGNVHGWQMSETSFKSCGPEPHAVHGKITAAQTAFAHDWNCRECKKPISVAHGNSDQLKARRECFLCNYWVNLIRKTEAGDRVIVGGVHFIAGDWNPQRPTNGKFAGFAGRKFVVRFTDGPNKGKTLTTYNLWHQGPIPERFRDRLPDNAEFVENTSAVQPV